jgi:cell shape-determining protein MreC
MLFTWFMLGALILLFAPHNLTGRLQFAFARVFHWPLSLGRSITLSARMQQNIGETVPRQDYERLQRHLLNLEARLEQAQKNIDKLSGLRNRLPFHGAKFVLAEVITANISDARCELIINRGQDDGLAKGQYVLAGNSVIGTLHEVGSRTSRVRLFTDPSSNVAVKVGGSDRFMQGLGNKSARIQLAKEAPRVGADIMALAKAGFLDAPMVVAKVTRCEKNAQSPLLWDVVVESACDIEKVVDVAVVVMNPQ